MVKIKRKVEMTLPELIEWGFKTMLKIEGLIVIKQIIDQ